jgi:exopolysaccharide biosynthesis polyprenyl glycosylphosphotransferase
MLRRGVGARNIALITTEDDMHGLARRFSEHPELGFFVQRQFASFDVSAESAMEDLVNASKLDEIFLARPHLDEEMLQRLVSFCSEHHVTFRYVADVAPIPLSHVEIASIAGIPIIEVKRTSLEGWGRVWKRLFDVVFSSLGLLILSPFFGIISLLIKLDTEGPAIKSLVRIGEKGKPFLVYKFRSMVKDAEKLKEQLLAYNERNDGPLFKMKNDPRITRMGKFLRATSIDELPQLWNVFRGDMSMVGPRPHEPREVAKYSLMQKKLLTLKPGMTGLAQVSGRSDLKFEQEALLDIYYIEHWSMVRDILILLRTPSAILIRRNAV